MAERRMFAKTLIDSDMFLDMPLSTQALYFHLSMRADDEGFVNNPKKIVRMIGADEDSLRLLIAKQFILPFDSGIVVIKHWRIHNYIQKDRFKKTVYTAERAQIVPGENGEYMLAADRVDTECIHDVSSLETQVRLGKVSIGNNNISIDFHAEFEAIWKSYPRKIGKPNAERSYIKARKEGTTKEEVIDGLNRYLEYIRANRTDTKYIKHGATWFNQRGWTDDYTLPTSQRPIPLRYDEEGYELDTDGSRLV
jgi:hypothetical protein